MAKRKKTNEVEDCKSGEHPSFFVDLVSNGEEVGYYFKENVQKQEEEEEGKGTL